MGEEDWLYTDCGDDIFDAHDHDFSGHYDPNDLDIDIDYFLKQLATRGSLYQQEEDVVVDSDFEVIVQPDICDPYLHHLSPVYADDYYAVSPSHVRHAQSISGESTAVKQPHLDIFDCAFDVPVPDDRHIEGLNKGAREDKSCQVRMTRPSNPPLRRSPRKSSITNVVPSNRARNYDHANRVKHGKAAKGQMRYWCPVKGCNRSNDKIANINDHYFRHHPTLRHYPHLIIRSVHKPADEDYRRISEDSLAIAELARNSKWKRAPRKRMGTGKQLEASRQRWEARQKEKEHQAGGVAAEPKRRLSSANANMAGLEEVKCRHRSSHVRSSKDRVNQGKFEESALYEISNGDLGRATPDFTPEARQILTDTHSSDLIGPNKIQHNHNMTATTTLTMMMSTIEQIAIDASTDLDPRTGLRYLRTAMPQVPTAVRASLQRVPPIPPVRFFPILPPAHDPTAITIDLAHAASLHKQTHLLHHLLAQLRHEARFHPQHHQSDILPHTPNDLIHTTLRTHLVDLHALYTPYTPKYLRFALDPDLPFDAFLHTVYDIILPAFESWYDDSRLNGGRGICGRREEERAWFESHCFRMACVEVQVREEAARWLREWIGRSARRVKIRLTECEG